MKLEKVTGAFNCRKFKPNTPWAQREVVPQGERIDLSIAFTEEELKTFAPEYGLNDFANYSEKTGKYYVSFKIFPKTCKAVNSKAQRIDFPQYSLIDGEYFLLNLEYAVKHGDTKKMELNGCYVNSIQFIKPVNVSFEAVEDGDDSWLGGSVNNETFFEEQAKPADIGNDDLPFSAEDDKGVLF